MSSFTIEMKDRNIITVSNNHCKPNSFVITDGEKTVLCKFFRKFDDSELKDLFILYIYNAIERLSKSDEDFFDTVEQRNWRDCCESRTMLHQLGWILQDVEDIYDWMIRPIISDVNTRLKTNV
jgi:hypothetical protein